MVLYLTGVLIAGVLFVVKLLRLFQLRAKGVKSPQLGYEVIRLPDSKEAFSFFNWVFLGDQIPVDEERHILEHEAVHIGQRHTIDLLFFELLRIVCWYNPLVYLYQIRLSEVHEFAADRICAKGEPQAIYLDLLSAAFGVNRMSFVNQFAAMSLLRKRIAMLKRAPSGQKQLLRFALILPLVLVILTYTSCELVKAGQNSKTDEIIEVDYQQQRENQTSAFRIENQPQDSTWNPQEERKAQTLIGQLVDLQKERDRLLKITKRSNPAIVNLNNQLDKLYQEALELALKKKEVTGEDDLLNRVKNLDSRSKQKGVATAAEDDTISIPIFPGCENAADKKACFTQKMTEYLAMSMEYPPTAEKEGIEGKVQVVFTINKQGQVEGLKAHSDNKIFEKEALRLIQELPDFTPATRDGEPAPYPMTVPIQFKLSGYTAELHSCADLIAEYSANLEKKKNDLDWVKRAVSQLYSSECSSEPLFQKLFDQRLRLDPSSDTYFFSGMLKERTETWREPCRTMKRR